MASKSVRSQVFGCDATLSIWINKNVAANMPTGLI